MKETECRDVLLYILDRTVITEFQSINAITKGNPEACGLGIRHEIQIIPSPEVAYRKSGNDILLGPSTRPWFH